MKSGRLEVIVGPMFSGKSEELIRRLTRAGIAGKQVVAFKPAIDDRYDIEKIVSHSGSSFGAIREPNIWMMERVTQHMDVIGVDEAQFFDPDALIEQVRLAVAQDKAVIVSGLDMTFRQEPFGAMPTLMALADRVDKLNAVCHTCGEDAVLTQRLTDGKPSSFSEDTIEVGGLETYEARCRNCFEPGH